MFGWLYRKVADGITPIIIDNVLDYAESKEGSETITAFIDGHIDRQIQRIQGSIGGSLKGTKSQDGFSSGNIWGALVQAYLSRAGQGAGQAINSTLANELYRTG